MVTRVQGRGAADVIAELSSLLYREGRLADQAAFLRAVMQRETICPTSMAPGWALPHGRVKGITELSFAVARSSYPLIWFGEGSIRPHMVFLFAVPEAEAKMYLNLVAGVAKLSQKPTLLEQLHSAPDGDSMFRILEQIPLRETRQPGVAAARIG